MIYTEDKFKSNIKLASALWKGSKHKHIDER